MIVEPAKPEDRQGILAVTANIDIFSDEEKDTVRELWDEQEKGYNFLVAPCGYEKISCNYVKRHPHGCRASRCKYFPRKTC